MASNNRTGLTLLEPTGYTREPDLTFCHEMIRSYQHGDHEAIAEIFPRAVHEIASEVYTEKQCNAWSERTPNAGHWEKRCEVKRPFVFVSQGKVVGFLELDSDGHIDCMYVHPEHKRKGIASRLVDHAVRVCCDAGLRRVFVEASICAKPVFETNGFRLIEEKMVEIRGEHLTNFVMELRLTHGEQDEAKTSDTAQVSAVANSSCAAGRQ